ncbi:E3 ubiquitin-protein ligase TRIM71-like isoform X2 [Dysidea avara]|uniref:E3 ubiquitin-protein ligase TRIM71-like isoform X2 n=1 Tax=Dysidea avara TaxID=196820 RepID=UPI00331D186C
MALRQSPRMMANNCVLLMEYLNDPDVELQEAITSSEECARLSITFDGTRDSTMHSYQSCHIHPRRRRDLICKHCKVGLCSICAASADHTGHEITFSFTIVNDEIRRINQSIVEIENLLSEMKGVLSEVRKMRDNVINKKESNVKITREVFSTLRAAINKQENKVILNIEESAARREKTLKLERLLLLWSQLNKCLELMKKTREIKMTTDELVSRRKILEQRQNYLMLMKRKSRLEPVIKEQTGVEYGEEVEYLCEQVAMLGRLPLDPSKCEVTIPTTMAIVNKESALKIILRDVNDNIVDGRSSEVKVSIAIKTGEPIVVEPVKDISGGGYTVSFTPRTLEDHVSVIVNGQHIQGSPHKVTAALRDYSKIEVQNCQVIIQCGRKKFKCPHNLAIATNDDVIMLDYTNHDDFVVIMDKNLKLVRTFGQGSGDGKLRNPLGVAVGHDVIAVSEWSNHVVKKFTLERYYLSKFGSHGNGNGQFNHPHGLTFSGKGTLYVVDHFNCRVQVFDDKNKFLFKFGSKGFNPGEFQKPCYISLDSSNQVYVTDWRFGGGIVMFSEYGNFIKKINCIAPYSICLTPDDYIITDAGDCLTVFSPTHKLLIKCTRGSQIGQFQDIRGVTINSIGTIFVSEGDMYNCSRFQIIST